MKITIKKEKLSAYTLNSKKSTLVAYKDVFEIPDGSIEKMLAIVNEILDRSFHANIVDVRNDKQIILFPVFPFPFFQIVRIDKDDNKEIKENNDWIGYWETLPFNEIKSERVKLLRDLDKFEMLWFENDPELETMPIKLPNNAAIKFEIDREKLRNLKDLLEKNLTKVKKAKTKRSEEKILIDAELDFENKILVITHSTGEKEEIRFNKKQIKAQDSRFAINPKKLFDSEDEKTATKFFKAFDSYFNLKKTVKKFSEKEKPNSTISIDNLAKVLDMSPESARNYVKRIRKLITDNGLPMKLVTDNRGGYQLFIKLVDKIGTK